MGVDDIGGGRLGEKCANSVRLDRIESHDVAAAQESPQLNLSGRATRLRDNGGRRPRNESNLQPRSMVCPHRAVVAICGNECAGVVDGAQADRVLGPVSSLATRRRAAAISSEVSSPLARSHSATAASPSRTTSARRAASVIHADTLTPSCAAAMDPHEAYRTI